ncbi:hypothetical protein BC831DRAFT_397510 [Entophlyctis helioformis]|nr:hypothetical protein BC831DRAFT_397510 [Entophlyctis helioformis]
MISNDNSQCTDGESDKSNTGAPPSADQHGRRRASDTLTDDTFPCTECSRIFTRRHNLKSHMNVHTRERPFVCQDCGQRFGRLHDLKRHERTHRGVQPYTCKFCARAFTRQDALVRHLKSINNPKCSHMVRNAPAGADAYTSNMVRSDEPIYSPVDKPDTYTYQHEYTNAPMANSSVFGEAVNSLPSGRGRGAYG